MFSKEITGLTLTNEIASTVFPNIGGDKFRNDESFVATLRALLYSRVPKEESITLRYKSTDYSSGQLSGSSPRDCVRAFFNRTPIMDGSTGILLIHSFEGSDESNTTCFEKLVEGVPKTVSGYKLLADLSAWIESDAKFRAKVYVNEEYSNTIIFTEKMNMKRWHMLESLISRYFPWYFESNPMTDEEIEIVKTLTKRYAPSYETKIQEFAKRFDFRSQVIRNQLTGFETHFDRRKLESVRSQISDMDRRIRELENNFSSYYQQMNDLRTQECGLVDKITHGGGAESSELLDYFLCNNSLHLVSVYNGEIKFIVTTTVANFDPDAAESVIQNNRSYIYEYRDNENMTADRVKRLMTEIFVKETMKIRICAAYSLNFDNGRYAGISGYDFPSDIIMDHTPNQHIQAFHCLGGNEATIRQSMRNRDYVGAVAACVQSAKSVNVQESATTGKMTQLLFSNRIGKVIEMPDGTTKTPFEAVLWLEEQDVKAKKEKEQEESHE